MSAAVKVETIMMTVTAEAAQPGPGTVTIDHMFSQWHWPGHAIGSTTPLRWAITVIMMMMAATSGSKYIAEPTLLPVSWLVYREGNDSGHPCPMPVLPAI